MEQAPDPFVKIRTGDNLKTAGHFEGRGFETKGPGLRDDKAFFVKVARAALSMGNLRDGGHVVVGIDDAKPERMMPGLDDAHLASWLAYDDVSDRLAVYADPPLRFDLTELELATGVRVAVLQVHEFDDVPHLCARAFPGELRKGGLYVRSRKKPETAEIASSGEMREILDLAAEKRLRAYIETAERAGVRIVPGGEAADRAALADRARFESQLGTAWDE